MREQLYITFTPTPEKKLIVTQGSYTLAGQNVTLTYIPMTPFPSTEWQLITTNWNLITTTWT